MVFMEKVDNQWSYSNSGPDTLHVWLEPWAEGFNVPIGSTILLRSPSGCDLGEVEWNEDHLTVWASANNVEVFIDHVLQDSASAVIPAPDGLTKGMLNILFAGQPSARLGGASNDAEKRISLWQRVKSHLRL